MLGKLSEEAKQWIAPFIDSRTFAPRDRLTEQAALESTVRILKVGIVTRYRKGIDWRERPLCIAERGAAFGLFGVMGQPNQSSAVAASSGRLCEVPVEALRALTRFDAQAHHELWSFATKTWGRIAAWSEGIRLRGTDNRLAYALVLISDSQDQSMLALPTHSAMARLLGTTRESIVRAMSVLEDEALIHRRDRRSIEVNRERLLERLSRSSLGA